jgi:hypothetical protein
MYVIMLPKGPVDDLKDDEVKWIKKYSSREALNNKANKNNSKAAINQIMSLHFSVNQSFL